MPGELFQHGVIPGWCEPDDRMQLAKLFFGKHEGESR